jgi:hypothetical protein
VSVELLALASIAVVLVLVAVVLADAAHRCTCGSCQRIGRCAVMLGIAAGLLGLVSTVAAVLH